MKSRQQIKLNEKHVKKYKKGYPLLFSQAMSNPSDVNGLEEGTLLTLTEPNGRFVATAYYGIQNKGIGWVLSKIQSEAIDDFYFKKKLYKGLEKRMGLYKNPKTNCFRVFNGEGDGIGGLTIDFFAGYYLINYYSPGIYHFKSLIEEALSEIVEYDGIYEYCRFDQNAAAQKQTDHSSQDMNDGFVMGKRAKFPIIVKENGEKFAIYFNDGAMVGVFLDQREVRRQIRNKYARGKDVLNLFAYTGAFTVFAAKGDAKSTTTVDVANRTLERTQEHFELNDISGDAHQIIIEDVFNYFDYAEKKDLTYDLVILDPPSFAKSKTMTFSAEKDYPSLLAECIELTRDNGIIVACNNSANISLDKFKQFVGKAFNMADARFEVLEYHSLPKDFRTHPLYEESSYLKVAFLKVLRKQKIEDFILEP